MKPNPDIELGSRVTLSPGITKFHYEVTPTFSLEYVLKKLQQNRSIGIVRRLDKGNDAWGVQFPNMKDLMWFKSFEIEAIKNALSFKQISHK
jgi:hypothetical protein